MFVDDNSQASAVLKMKMNAARAVEMTINIFSNTNNPSRVDTNLHNQQFRTFVELIYDIIFQVSIGHCIWILYVNKSFCNVQVINSI